MIDGLMELVLGKLHRSLSKISLTFSNELIILVLVLQYANFLER